MTTSRSKRRARVLRLVRAALAALVLLGFGASVTAAAWRDDVSLSATAQASSFDIWARFGSDAEWDDVGLPGDPDTFIDGYEVELTSVADALPGQDYAHLVRLCNAGSVDGVISSATLTSNGLLVAKDSIEVDGIDVNTVIPAHSCPANPTDLAVAPNAVQGNIHFTTTSGWGTAEYGKSDRVILKIRVRSVT